MTGVVFSRLYLPRPLDAAAVERVLLRFAADRASPAMMLEVRADERGIQHLLGVPAEHSRWAQRTLRDLLPGVEIDGQTTEGSVRRLPVSRVARLRVRHRALALATDRPELTTAALLSALHAHLTGSETLVLQLVLGPRLAPKHLRGDLPDPGQPWWELLARGKVDAPTEARKHLAVRPSQSGFAATIRLGVHAETGERRQRLLMGLLGALSTAHAPGVSLDLRPEPAQRLNGARPPRFWWPLHLSVGELVGPLAWPITPPGSDGELPGLPPLHPRQLRVPEQVSKEARVFARNSGPGLERPVGLSAVDALGHLVALGPTGSGKSTALLNLIAADARDGRSVLVVDPKRQLVDDILDRAIPENRIDDVVIIDPSLDRPPGFNPLDVGSRDPDVVVDSLLAVFAAVFHEGWGPRTQDILHGSLLTIARANVGRQVPFTLLDVPRLLTDSAFRMPIIGRAGIADDPGLGQFWAWYQSQSPGAQAQAIAAPLNKLRQYLLRPSVRRILGQPQPVFRLRDVFRERKIVLVPLNEGLIGPLTAQLLGSLIVAEAWQATQERAKETNPTSRPGLVYVDEVQQYLHLPTSIGDALAQSRSLGVGWHLAHQYRRQLPPELRAAVDSNAKSKLVFQPLDPDDARDLARQAPSLEPVDFMSLGQYQAYANLVASGAPAGWCTVTTLPPPTPTGLGARLRAASQSRYGGSVPPPTPTPPTGRSTGPSATAGPMGRKRKEGKDHE